MITSVRLKNFKNFSDQTLHLGPLTLIVGANAAGKSNICDSLRFLHGIGRKYTFNEIIFGKYSPSSFPEWQPIRGAKNEIARFGENRFLIDLHLKVPDSNIQFSIEISRKRDGRFYLTYENLSSTNGNSSGYNFDGRSEKTHPRLTARYAIKEDEEVLSLNCQNNRSILTQLTELSEPIRIDEIGNLVERINHHRKEIDGTPSEEKLTSMEALSNRISRLVNQFFLQNLIDQVHHSFSSMRFLDLSPSRIREASFPDQTTLGDHGENFPSALLKICENKKRQKELTDWVRELTPMDVIGFQFPRDPSGRIHVQFREQSGNKVSMYSASDGTLRFLAIPCRPTERRTTSTLRPRRNRQWDTSCSIRVIA